MAVVTVKSAAITNRDATPRVLNNARDTRGSPKHMAGEFVITNGDSVGSKYLIGSVPSNAMVGSVKVSAPDIGTTTAGDIGLYRSTEDGGAVVDADFFASAQALNAGPYNKVEVVNESGVYTLANMVKPLWQALGLTSDPKIVYDVVLTLTGAADAGGTGLIEVDWTE